MTSPPEFAPPSPTTRWPWLRLFDAAIVALSPRMLVLAFVLALGGKMLDAVGTFTNLGIGPDAALPEWNSLSERTSSPVGYGLVRLRAWLGDELNAVGTPWMQVIDLSKHAAQFVVTDYKTWRPLVWGSILVAYGTFAGLALARLAALEYAQADFASLPGAVRVASRWYKSAIMAPLIPFVACLILSLGVSAIQALGLMPVIGQLFGTILLPVAAIVAILLGLLWLALLLTWPLMPAAVAVEGCDSFSALSRAYSFLSSRTLLLGWCGCVSLIFGSLLRILIHEFLFGPVWSALRWSTALVDRQGGVSVLELPINAVVYLFRDAAYLSLFWTLVALSYLILRQSCDRIRPELVAPDTPPPVDPYPVVGMPAVVPQDPQ